jgi:glycosyltransferase involved in cell wall biosynthesis
LLIGSPESRFVRDDLDHLKDLFQVDFYQPKLFFLPKKGRSPLLFFKLFFKVMRSQVVLCWFANVDCFFACLFAKFLRKRFIVVVGGVDAAYQPEIDYGYFTKRSTQITASFVYRFADVIAPVDSSLASNLQHYLPFDISDRVVVLPTGYDSRKWSPSSASKKRLVLTVGAVNWSNYRRKGFQTFIETARAMPTVRFVLAGKFADSCADTLREQGLPPNLEFAGFVSDEDLLHHYQQATVYCQLSKFEGLPNALCEAMLCECFPIGTQVCGIPSAIGETGVYVRYGCVSDCVRAIKFALSLGRCSAARRRIIDAFPQRLRKRGLVHIITGFKLMPEFVELGAINHRERRVIVEPVH